MKNSSNLVFLTFFISVISAFAAVPNIRYRTKIIQLPPTHGIQIETIFNPQPLKIKPVNQTKLFLTAVGRRESSNRYDIVNRWGYMGKYQFGRKTLNALGYKHISNKQFLSNPQIQEEAMIKLLKHNKHVLRREIRKYCGTQKHGVYITESGLLAAAHLAGPGNVKKWLRRGKHFKDGLGTDLTEYLKLFGSYEIII